MGLRQRKKGCLPRVVRLALLSRLARGVPQASTSHLHPITITHAETYLRRYYLQPFLDQELGLRTAALRDLGLDAGTPRASASAWTSSPFRLGQQKHDRLFSAVPGSSPPSPPSDILEAAEHRHGGALPKNSKTSRPQCSQLCA